MLWFWSVIWGACRGVFWGALCFVCGVYDRKSSHVWVACWGQLRECVRSMVLFPLGSVDAEAPHLLESRQLRAEWGCKCWSPQGLAKNEAANDGIHRHLMPPGDENWDVECDVGVSPPHKILWILGGETWFRSIGSCEAADLMEPPKHWKTYCQYVSDPWAQGLGQDEDVTTPCCMLCAQTRNSNWKCQLPAMKPKCFWTSLATIRINGVNVFTWMEWMSEAFARDCQVNVWMDKTSLLAAENLWMERKSLKHSSVNGKTWIQATKFWTLAGNIESNWNGDFQGAPWGKGKGKNAHLSRKPQKMGVLSP